MGIHDTTHDRMRYILTSYELPLFKGSSDGVWKYRWLQLKIINYFQPLFIRGWK